MLPQSVREIADVIGRDAALYLIEQLPKCQARDHRNPDHKSQRVILYVPKRLKPNHRLVQILGPELAAKMVEGFQGEILYPANCQGKSPVSREKRNREIARLVGEGRPMREVAEIVGLTSRQVRNVMREIPQEERAPHLSSKCISKTLQGSPANDT